GQEQPNAKRLCASIPGGCDDRLSPHADTLPRTSVKLPLILLTTVLWSVCGGLPEPGPPFRPEHPRPGMERAEWLSLNGVWAFQADAANQGRNENWSQEPPRFDSAIRVPFPWQSEGVPDAAIGWYRRALSVPSDWSAATTWLRTEGV